MILGVVLGNIAELNLSRALAITTDLTPFVTRPWSLFFLIVSIFSAIYPFFQAAQGKKAWTYYYPAVIALCLSLPVFMMGGVVRPALAAMLLVLAAYLGYQAFQKHKAAAA